MTLRELLWRHEAIQIDRWNHTARITATFIAAMGGKNVPIETQHPILSRRKRRTKRQDNDALERYIQSVERRQTPPNAPETE